MKRIFDYLKKNKITDTSVINRLFVSAFVICNSLKIEHNSILKGLIINNDNIEEKKHLKNVIDKLYQYDIQLDFEALIKLFEYVISPSDRQITGAIYTPAYIRNAVINACLKGLRKERLSNSTIADISCGCGGFLIDSAIYMHKKTDKPYKEIFANNIYGIDIESYSVTRTKIILSLLGVMNGEDINFTFHIIKADTLDYYKEEFNPEFKHFDFVFGNPPYVCSRNMDATIKEKLINYDVCKWGHPDLYIPFIKIAVDILNEGGKLGYITMNSFLNSANGRGLREFIMENNYDVSIIDFRSHQIFTSRSTYTCLFYLVKDSSECIKYANKSDGQLDGVIQYESINYKDLDAKKGWSLNNNRLTTRIESCGIPLRNFCQSRHGIATLNNDTYIFKPVAEDLNYYTLSKNKVLYKIEKNICRDVVNSNKLNSDASFESLVEKVILPYNYDNIGKPTIIEEKEMAACYPMAYAYLVKQRIFLEQRDKGHIEEYPAWYAFGRTQSLTMPRYKLFFPKIANKSLKCVIVDDSKLMLYNGMAFVSDDINKLNVLKCFLESDIFWDYVTLNAKPYASGYSSLNGANIMNFGIPELDTNESNRLIMEHNLIKRNDMIKKLYMK